MTSTSASGHRPLIAMSLSTLLFSLWPALLDSSLAVSNPFIFNANLLSGKVLAVAAFLLVFHPSLFRWTSRVDGQRKRPFIALTWELCRSPLMFWSVVANFAHLLFALSVRYVDTTIATIFHEASPILHMWLLAELSRPRVHGNDEPSAETRRYSKIGFTSIALWILALIGMAFVVGGSGSADSATPESYTLASFGILLAVASGVAGALNAVHLRWGADLRRAMNEWPRPTIPSPEQQNLDVPTIAERDSVELACIMTCYGIAAAAMMPISYAFGFATGGQSFSYSFLVTIGAGILVFFPGHLLARWSFMKTHDLSINAVGYATPLLALLWLSLFTEIDKINNADLVILGAGAILAANILLQVQPELEDDHQSRKGFPALILGLWSCGAIVHFRHDLYEMLGIEDFDFPGEGYWGLLAAVSTTFALVLSFRVARLNERTTREDTLIVSLFRRMENLGRNGFAVSRSLHLLSKIDVEVDQEKLRTQYADARLDFRRLWRTAIGNREMSAELVAAEKELDQLVYGRRYGSDFAEYLAIWSLGILTTLILTVVETPGLEGFAKFVAELGTTVFGAVIVFLIANLSDLRIQRASRVIKLSSSGGRICGAISFPNTLAMRTERVIAVLIAVGLLSAFAALFW